MDNLLYWSPLILFSVLCYIRCRPFIRRDVLGRIHLRPSRRLVGVSIVGVVLGAVYYGMAYFNLKLYQNWMDWAVTYCLALLGAWLIVVEKGWRILFWLTIVVVMILCLPLFWSRKIRRFLKARITRFARSHHTARLRRQARKKACDLRRQLEIIEAKYGPTYYRLGGDYIDWGNMVYRSRRRR